MPTARVYRDGRKVTLTALQDSDFDRVLRKAVAAALNCSDATGAVEPRDVEVINVTRRSEDDTKYGLLVLVDARRLPSREANLSDRTGVLSVMLEAGVPKGLSFAVRIALNNEAWDIGGGKFE